MKKSFIKILSSMLATLIFLSTLTFSPITVSALINKNFIPGEIVEYNGHYYKIFDMGLNWNDARAYCETLGGHLVTITSKEEQEFIISIISDSQNYIWLGAYKNDDAWEWVTQEKWSYTNWKIGEPNNYLNRGENCLLMEEGAWNDQLSTGDPTGIKVEKISFICEWENKDSINDQLFTGLMIYSDHTNLNVKKDDVITIGAGIFVDNQQITDISKLTFSVYDTSILKVGNVSVHDNCRFVKLKALKTGTTYITFNDSNTGYISRVPITVYNTNEMAYTVSGVPTQDIEKYTTNFYNVNGLYIDSYEYTVNDNKSTTVSFDVYNTNYAYGVVEIYNKDGLMKDAVVIDKMTNNAGSIKEALWDNTCCLVRDIIGGDIFTYRQESGFSKKTSIENIIIPEGGYIKITTDASDSFLLGLINGVDLLMGLKSISDNLKGFNVQSKDFADKITKKLLKETVYAQMIKDENKYAEKLYKNVAKDATIFNSQSVGNFAETFSYNLNELELDKLIFDTTADFGWGVGESVFEYFSGSIGWILKGMFAVSDVANLIIECNHCVKSLGCGNIVIQNQGGGVRASSQITVTSDTNFDSDTALKAFEVRVNDTMLDLVKDANPDFYEQLSSKMSMTYNISMIKNGVETQLESEVEVSIPIPKNLQIYAFAGILKVYRIEDDGTTTEMDAKYRDGCLVFKTSHFSLYSMIPLKEVILGDVDQDGKIAIADAILVQKHIVNIFALEGLQLTAADVDKNGVVTIADAILIQKHIVGILRLTV